MKLEQEIVIDIANSACDLCMACVNTCPKKVFHLEVVKNKHSLVADAFKCDTCLGEKSCETQCPNHAITVFDS